MDSRSGNNGNRIEHLEQRVTKNSEDIVEIRIQLSTFTLVKTIVFGAVGLMITTLFSSMIGAAIWFASKG